MTGAAGLIGRHLRFSLNDQFRFWCIDKHPVNDMYIGDVVDVLDIGSLATFTDAWDSHPEITANLHAVIHLAAYYDFSNQPNPAYQRVNEGLERLLMLMSKDAPGDCLMISAGSMAALAPVLPGQRQNETSPRAGLWEYPHSKLQAERLLDQTTIRQPIVQLILAAVYSDWCELVPLFNWIEICASEGLEKYFYPGPPTRGLTYCHIEDVVRAFAITLQKFGPGGELIQQAEADLAAKRLKKSVEVAMEGGVRDKFLIGQPQPMTYREIHARACTAFRGKAISLMQLPPEVVTIGAWIIELVERIRKRPHFTKPWMIKFAGEHFSFDLTYVRTRLGWVPKKSIQQDFNAILIRAVRERANWLKINAMRPR
jgi:dihydroflavonol-4-reductase